MNKTEDAVVAKESEDAESFFVEDGDSLLSASSEEGCTMAGFVAEMPAGEAKPAEPPVLSGGSDLDDEDAALFGSEEGCTMASFMSGMPAGEAPKAGEAPAAGVEAVADAAAAPVAAAEAAPAAEENGPEKKKSGSKVAIALGGAVVVLSLIGVAVAVLGVIVTAVVFFVFMA